MLERVRESKCENSNNFPKNSKLGYCGSSDNTSAFIESIKQIVNG